MIENLLPTDCELPSLCEAGQAAMLVVLSPPLSLWSSLQSGLNTTSPLYAWNKSHVEDQYFAALRVDPMVGTNIVYCCYCLCYCNSWYIPYCHLLKKW